MGIRIRVTVTQTKKQPKQSAAEYLAAVAEGQRIANERKNGGTK